MAHAIREDVTRPVSQYELARMVVTVIQDLVRLRRSFTTRDVIAEVRHRHPDCDIRYYDQSWDGTPAPWYPGEPFRRGHVAERGVQSLVHELMQVHLADEYTWTATDHDDERYLPLRGGRRGRDRRDAAAWPAA